MSILRTSIFFFTTIVIVSFSSLPIRGQNTLSPELTAKIDKIAADSLAASGVPSASVAVVKDG